LQVLLYYLLNKVERLIGRARIVHCQSSVSE
jgi:hypothetical protein